MTSDFDISRKVVDPSALFDLGDSGGSDIATNKDAMIAEAITALRVDDQV